MGKTLNLIYSSQKLEFFNQIRGIGGLVLKFKSEGVINDFGSADENEVNRGDAYAVFPELKTMFKKNQKITLAALRESLQSRGVIDRHMQNKAMAMLLQGKAGIHYAMGSLLLELLQKSNQERELSFFIPAGCYDVKFEVRNPTHVKLFFDSTCRCVENPEEDALQARVEIDITLEKIAIYKFNVTQIGKSEAAKDAFRFLQKNQVSIWQKILIFFKTYFKANSDLEVENVAIDKQPWSKNTKKIEEPSNEKDEPNREEPNITPQ